MTKTQEQTKELMSFLLPGVVVFLVTLFLVSPRCAIGVAPSAAIELLGILGLGKIVGFLRGEHRQPREA